MKLFCTLILSFFLYLEGYAQRMDPGSIIGTALQAPQLTMTVGELLVGEFSDGVHGTGPGPGLIAEDQVVTGRKKAQVKSLLVAIAPNPVVQQLRVFSEKPIAELEVIKATGEVLLSRQPANFNKEYVLDTSGFAAGSYLLRVSLVNGTHQTMRFLKLR